MCRASKGYLLCFERYAFNFATYIFRGKALDYPTISYVLVSVNLPRVNLVLSSAPGKTISLCLCLMRQVKSSTSYHLLVLSPGKLTPENLI